MTNCIIHIGMHKTGSSSIQNSLHSLDNDKFLYADLGPDNQSLAICSLFADHPEKLHMHSINNRNTEDVNAYIKQIEARLDKAIKLLSGRTLIISGEGISILSREGLVRLKDYFRSKFKAITIVGYIRSPARYIESSFQERIKNGLIEEFNSMPEYRNYKTSFNKFDEVFGRDCVRLWKFDPKYFPDGCVVKDFCKRLDIDLPNNRIIRANESLSKQVVSLLYTYRKFSKNMGLDPMRGKESQNINIMLKNVGKEKFRFSPDIIKPILKQNRADIEWMEKRLGVSLREKLGKHEPGDVRDESDLLVFDGLLIKHVLNLLGDDTPAGIKGDTPEEVALLVDALRRKHNTGEIKPHLLRRIYDQIKNYIWTKSEKNH